jgi:DNA-directed RNA polymerase subunit E'/Rpb7
MVYGRTMKKYATTQEFTKIVQLEPSKLGTNIPNYIAKLLQDDCKTYCSKSKGYIIDKPQIVSLGEYIISHTTGKCKIKVKYTCQTVKPEPGHVYTAFIKLISSKGIFAQTNQVNIFILIPVSELTDWVFDKTSFKKDKKSVEIGDWINVEITTVQFDQHKYGCIGKLVI